MQRRFADFKNRSFDLLVVGGGIYGAWIAYDAALRGLSTALVDQGDWASGTSSASTKLIHGGLRYLEQGHLGLVRKSLRERAALLQAGPHRVRPLRFGVPIRAGGKFGEWPLRLGLSIYDLLGGLRPGSAEAHRLLTPEEFRARFSWLKGDMVSGGALYTDAQTDDTRLVLELVSGALAAGAVCVNYCAALACREENGRAAGAVVKDAVDGEQTVVKARCIVRATGPWLARSGARCRLSKGVHLVMPPLPGEDALLFPAESDGRVIFLIPWYGCTLLGTTDTEYAGDPEQVRVEPKDVAYLLAAANEVLDLAWDESDIRGRFAGLRVLRDRPRASSYALRRDFAVEETADGCLLSLGGKLTSARQDAATLVDRVCRKLGQRRSCATLGRPLPWAPAGDFAAFSEAALTQGRDLGLADEDVHWLIFRHGRRIEEIFAGLAGHPELGQRLFPDAPFLRADLLHCARQEMVVHLEDLLRRRLCLLLLRPARRPELEALAAEVAPILGWDKARRRLEVECCLGMEGPRSSPHPASLATPTFENGEPGPPLARHS